MKKIAMMVNFFEFLFTKCLCFTHYVENSECLETEFSCDGTKCLQNPFKCDNVQDCEDGTDETGCPGQGRCMITVISVEVHV